MALTKNVGGMDRTIRIVLGLLFLSIGLLGNLGTAGKTISFVLAAIGLVTGFVQFCPLSALLGINTCKTSRG
jgi:hypothetical protein